MISSRRLLLFSSFLILLGVISSSGSHASPTSPPMIEFGEEPSLHEEGEVPVLTTPCSPEKDPLCSRKVKEVLLGLRLLEPQIEGGVRLGTDSGSSGVVRFSMPLLQANLPLGDLELVGFEAIGVPEAGGFRIRLTTLEGEALYFCKVDSTQEGTDPETKVLSPFAGLSQDCRPDSAWGVGGTLVEYQHDSAPKRWSARWLELHAVYNFLKNGQALDRLQHQLHAIAGVAVETSGGQPGTGTALRGNFAVSGMIRSSGLGWEVKGYAGFRPNLIQWDDWAAEARLEVLYRVLFSRRWEAHFGVKAEATHWSIPSRSLGAFASSTEQDSAMLGLIFGVSFR